MARRVIVAAGAVALTGVGGATAVGLGGSAVGEAAPVAAVAVAAVDPDTACDDCVGARMGADAVAADGDIAGEVCAVDEAPAWPIEVGSMFGVCGVVEVMASFCYRYDAQRPIQRRAVNAPDCCPRAGAALNCYKGPITRAAPRHAINGDAGCGRTGLVKVNVRPPLVSEAVLSSRSIDGARPNTWGRERTSSLRNCRSD